jgi:hypothetical protein
MKKLTRKQQLIAIVIAVLLLGGGSWWAFGRSSQAEPEAPQATKKRIQSPVNVIDVAERPYLRLDPSSDGRYVTINVLEVKKAATQLDYEMEYQTGSMLQGFQGLLTLDKLPKSDRKLFGSQSAGGAITYHEDIKGGSLLAQFGGSEDYAVKSAWRFFQNTAKDSKFTSQDTKFSISNDALASVRHLIVYNSPGYPAALKGELLSDPYVVSADQSLQAISSNFTVSFRSSNAEAVIMGYDGAKWQELETSAADGLLTSTGPFMEVYLLTSK